MKLRRDTYHDYIDAMALAEAGRLGAERLITRTVAELARRSGAKNVANSVLHTSRPVFADCYALAVSFDSGAWTGRNG